MQNSHLILYRSRTYSGALNNSRPITEPNNTMVLHDDVVTGMSPQDGRCDRE